MLSSVPDGTPGTFALIDYGEGISSCPLPRPFRRPSRLAPSATSCSRAPRHGLVDDAHFPP